MKKSTKGALAAGSAAVLLMGGAGTLAYWTAEADVDGIAVTAGELKIAEDTNTCLDADWIFDSGEDVADKAYADGDLIVPGDVLTKDCQFVIIATGEHLRAEVELTNPVLSDALAPDLTLDDSFTVGGVDLDEDDITETNNGDTVVVSLSVTFNGSADNGTQTLDGALSAFEISLSQVHD